MVRSCGRVRGFRCRVSDHEFRQRHESRNHRRSDTHPKPHANSKRLANKKPFAHADYHAFSNPNSLTQPNTFGDRLRESNVQPICDCFANGDTFTDAFAKPSIQPISKPLAERVEGLGFLRLSPPESEAV